jgi:hypothetical protein
LRLCLGTSPLLAACLPPRAALPAATATPRPAPAPPGPTPAPPGPTATPRPAPTPAGPSAEVAPPATPAAAPGREPVWIRAGLEGVDLRALAADPRQPGTLYAGGAGLFKSSDAGGRASGGWVALRRDLQVRDIAVSPADPAVVYAGSTEFCLKGTTAPSYRSEDGGRTWRAIGGNLTSYAPHPARREVVYAAACPSVVRSADGGKTWQALEGSRDLNYEAHHVALAPSAPDVLYAMSASEGGTVQLAKSEDGGATWQDVTPSEQIWAPAALEVHPRNPNVAYAVTWTGVFRTDDGGARWTRANDGLEAARRVDVSVVTYPLSALAIDPARPDVLYLGTGGLGPEGLGIYRSLDGGVRWHRLGDGLGSRPVRAIVFAGPFVFAATGDGVWRVQW